MRRVIPDGASVDLTDAYGGLDPPASGWVAIGMVTSLDGVISIDGRSGEIGGDGDLAAFRALRGLADVVVAGSSTVQAEGYTTTWPVRSLAARRRRGQADRARLAVVTGSGTVDPDAPVFAAPDRPPLLLTTTDGATEADRRGVHAELVIVDGDDGRVDPVAAVAALRGLGLPRIVLEGGPSMNASWLGAGVVDELFVTVAPLLVGGDGHGIAGRLADPLDLVLHEARAHGSELVLRYLVDPARYRPDDDEKGGS